MTLLDWWETWLYWNGSHSMGFSFILTLFICPNFLIRPSSMTKFAFFQTHIDPFTGKDQIRKASWHVAYQLFIVERGQRIYHNCDHLPLRHGQDDLGCEISPSLGILLNGLMFSLGHTLKLVPIGSHIRIVLVLPNEGSRQVFP